MKRTLISTQSPLGIQNFYSKLRPIFRFLRQNISDTNTVTPILFLPNI